MKGREKDDLSTSKSWMYIQCTVSLTYNTNLQEAPGNAQRLFFV